MTPKKNKGADLEGKRGLFFLFGIALSLTAAIFIIQIEKGVAKPDPPRMPTYTFNDDSTPRTVRIVEEMEVKKLEKVNPEMSTEVVPDDYPILEIKKLFDNPKEQEQGLTLIEVPDELHNVETIPFVVMENIARPFDCQGITDKDAQKVCFNEWIQKHIAKNTQYPELAKQIGLEGKVYVNFVISETGMVEEVSLVQGEYEILNNEAVRVLSSMPQMIPGSQRGRKAKMQMTIPVNFKLGNR